MALLGARVLWDMADGPMPRGLLGVGSGDLVHDGHRWVLLLGGYSTSFRNRLYLATAPPTAHPATATWTVVTGAWGRAAPLLPDPPRSAWDGGGVHTPSFLPAEGDVPDRIYYAGRSGRRHVGPGSRYSLGLLERRDGRWERRETPVLTGDDERPSVLEPRVVRHGGRYVLWYLATPHEVVPGEQPDYELRTSTSADGVGGWTPPTVFATAQEGFFDVALVRAGAGWEMLLARGTNLHGTVPYPTQGLWLTSAAHPSPERQDWTPPVRVLDTDAPGTPEWMAGGVCDPAAVRDPDGTLTVVVTGTRRRTGWFALARGRLRRGHRPPPPAPFHLATAVLRLGSPGASAASDPAQASISRYLSTRPTNSDRRP
ncbi:hypothetical protein [Cellulomonas cellasea]|uniref:Uncharacterized protein n=1 Tax=Cellulomonas cellasea TaxID=43670 RepID=A0A7W4YCM9_9CELL|nr:hypothetical protein [Cellulomonas cellasea]MBB2924279.1 hypothetical protein [Cellulomonas cellasea]